MGYELVNNGEALSWEEFEKIIQEDIENHKNKVSKAKSSEHHSSWIYRGQANAEWELVTTYERYLKDELGVEDTKYSPDKFYRYLLGIVPAINSLISKKFERFSLPVKMDRHTTIPEYALICFARHNGFPTPLLDWTYSFYVAAFFAFASAKPNDDVAIFAYKEWNGDGRGGWVGAPMLDTQGPYVETHPRHYKQQSTYTVCRAEDENSNTFFMKHEDAVNGNAENHWIKKFIIKSDQKSKVLEKLYSMNINHYTLFGSDESLMQNLAYREIVLGGVG